MYLVSDASSIAFAQYYFGESEDVTIEGSGIAYGVYASDAAMKEAGNDYSTFTASGYWTIVDGLPVFGAPAEA